MSLISKNKKSCLFMMALISFLGCNADNSASKKSTQLVSQDRHPVLASKNIELPELQLASSSPTLVASHADIARVSIQGEAMIDSPIVTFMANGQRRFISSSVRWYKDSNNRPDFLVFHSLIKGSLDKPFSEAIHIKDQTKQFPNFRDFPGKWWIVNTYQEGSDLLAFVHVEFTNGLFNGEKQLNFGSTYIGLAFSNDGGQTFRYLGNVIAPTNQPIDHNIEGAPYLIKDGYFYVYYLDVGGISVARAQKNEVLSAARNKTAMPTWEKWNDGQWTPGIGGPSKPLGIGGITHSDAAYCTATNKFYLTTTRQVKADSPSSISILESVDGINWKLVKDIEPLRNGKVGWQYLSIVDKSGSDNATVGNVFYIYVGKEPNVTSSSELYRIEINASALSSPDVYQGLFLANGGIFYSNGSVRCYFRDMPHFTCATGKTDGSNLPYRPELLSSLRDGSSCESPSPCRSSSNPQQPPKPSYTGVFRAMGGVNYSNGSIYCYFRSMAHFSCLTGKTDASSFPERADLLTELKNGGACGSPKCP